jgi:hypothetical protein
LTVEYLIDKIDVCDECPASEYCYAVGIAPEFCESSLREWAGSPYVERKCLACKYCDLSAKDEPCHSCSRLYTRDTADKWVAKCQDDT